MLLAAVEIPARTPVGRLRLSAAQLWLGSSIHSGRACQHLQCQSGQHSAAQQCTLAAGVMCYGNTAISEGDSRGVGVGESVFYVQSKCVNMVVTEYQSSAAAAESEQQN